MRILITGATGLIGRQLGKELVRKGHELYVVSRNADKARRECPYPCRVIEGDLAQAPLTASGLANIEAVFHLMGENVGEGRWTEEKKKQLVDSRVRALENLRQSVPGGAVLISASAVGFYGDRGDQELNEDSVRGEGFLAELCEQWENAGARFTGRKVFLRTGGVLAKAGGMLPEIKAPAQMGVGGKLGSGEQWVSWIHIQDLVRLYVYALENPALTGAMNATAPHPVRSRELTAMIAKKLRRPHWAPVPSLAVKALFGEKAEIVLASQKVFPKKALQHGFDFLFPNLKEALDDLLADEAAGYEVFEAEQYLPKAREEIFPFFAQAANLGAITPEWLDFRLTRVEPEVMGEGTLIDYRLKVHKLPIQWRTRIEEWRPPERFVDTQLKGPYQLWHHTHRFEPLGAGTLMTDRVVYKLPLGVLGQWGGGWFVKKDVDTIFAFRRRKIDQIFGLDVHK